MTEPQFDINAEWNKMIIRNLKLKHPELTASDIDILKRYHEWVMMGLDEESDDFVEFMNTEE